MGDLCFYHSADLDGHCSGAIVKRAHPEVELIGINYGDEFPWDKITGKTSPRQKVYMVDFCLQSRPPAPFKNMVALSGMCDLVWIDHHKSAIEEASGAGAEGMAGVREIGKAACELAWEFFFGRSVPGAVYLLGRYDVWDLDADPEVMPFQWGVRINEDTRPENSMVMWEHLFAGFIEDTVEKGQACLAYQKAQNTKYASSCAFESELDGHPVIVINKGMTNSQLFDSIWDAEKYHMMVTFVWRKGQWTVSMYSTREDIDVSEIAKARGGGGHKGAAGFQCDELPFPLGSA